MTFQMSCAGPLGVNQCPEGPIVWSFLFFGEEVLQLYLTPTSPVDVAAPGKYPRLAGKTGKREFIPKRLKENLPQKTVLPP
ncbi:hypothetical protein CDAR_230851 [Caerostris darwini]|uniref:Uncharacterized protein n=1 Tax=Caerostris darwini TaxID=1538125 RepID=A0AAV4S416_9ARAC|nr:hypothetical protein CDAR_230851 [Caerostris darwini]